MATKKRTKLTGQQFQAIREMATTVSGYDNTSPIWGKRLTEVLDIIEMDVLAGNTTNVLETLGELRKRLTKGALLAH